MKSIKGWKTTTGEWEVHRSLTEVVMETKKQKKKKEKKKKKKN